MNSILTLIYRIVWLFFVLLVAIFTILGLTVIMIFSFVVWAIKAIWYKLTNRPTPSWQFNTTKWSSFYRQSKTANNSKTKAWQDNKDITDVEIKS